MNVDLHCHSTASDGGLNPIELAQRAEAAGLELWSLTDHDTLAGYDELFSLDLSLKLVVGVEVSAQIQGFPVHIIVLNVDRNHPELNQLLQQQTLRRIERALSIASKLEHSGFKGVVEFVKSLQDRPVSRPEIAKYLVDTGQVKSIKKAFDKFLGKGKVGDIKQHWPEVAELAPCVKAAGGVCVLAHPDTYSLNRVKLRAMVAQFVEAGGVGIELPHEPQTATFYKYVVALADEFKLMVSVGSDFHSDQQSWRQLGKTPSISSQLTPIWSVFSA